LGPASFTGLDLNPASIGKCLERHKLPGLDFVQGDAENLPFPDQSFDAVVNVEASHQYPHFPRFLSEVARVLRPGGHFLYTDSRRAPVIAEWEEALADAPLRKVSERSIDAEAKRGLAANTRRTQERISSRLPAVMNSLIRYGVDVLDWDLRRRRVFPPGVLLRQGLMRAPGGRNRKARLRP
jgi:ubiquinone/menaquinone biosynthesis C-methylase UbiE